MKLLITDIGSRGEGIGRADGLAVFVPGALPGEEVEVEIVENKGRFATARLLEPSEHPCGSCGGCPLMRMEYGRQLEWKRSHVESVLRRIGGIEAPVVRPIAGMDDPCRYRNKAEFAVEKGKVGYYGAQSHDLCSPRNCRIQSPEAMAIAAAFERSPVKGVKQLIVRTAETGEVMAILASDRQELRNIEPCIAEMDASVEDLASVAWLKGGKIVPLAGKRTINDIIRTELSVLKTEVSPQSFYQVNPRQTEKLYGIVQRYAALTGGETVLDLYCGAGSIGLSMAGSCRRVIGVESVRPAVLDANRNAVINGIVNAEFICGKAEDIVPKRLQGINADVVILDPPRSGCKASLLQCVKDIAPERLIYVSCDPATLARDLKILADAFSFVEATPVDMFPHTRHVETVVLLSRESK